MELSMSLLDAAFNVDAEVQGRLEEALVFNEGNGVATHSRASHWSLYS